LGLAAHLMTTEWTSPLTSRLLLEAGAFTNTTGGLFLRGDEPNVIGCSSNRARSTTSCAGRLARSLAARLAVSFRAAASYITGAHAFKVGFNKRERRHRALRS